MEQMQGKVIIASNRLPVTITEQDGRPALSRSIGGVATALDSIFRTYNSLWVGWAGARRHYSDKELAKIKLPKGLVCVPAEPELVEAYYSRFANRVLWPSMHNFTPQYQATDEDWTAIVEIARRFAAAIKRVIGPDDIVWVHDYHLLMLPAELRKLGIQNHIGYFWHSPFPPPKYILQLPHAREILQSLYEVDVLGLQADRDVDNFWETMRAAGDHRQPGVVRAFPIGIDYEAYHNAAKLPAVRKIVADIKEQYPLQHLIYSASRLDYTKGILTELRSVERFLQSLPPKERVQYVYKLVVAPSREDVAGYLELKQEIEQLVQDVNKRLGDRHWKPVDYVYENFGFEQMSAWYIASEVLLLTPDIDGMNLITKEYIAAHHDNNGMLVVTNTMGAAFQLPEALQVEPNDVPATASAIARAFTLPSTDRKRRWEHLRHTAARQDVYHWADNVLRWLGKS
jgi:trehalose 6-phosphate synthase/phosphatase